MTPNPATDVKICGITTEDALTSAMISGAKFIGFVFYPGSPRYIEAEQAKILSNKTPTTIMNVGLFVDPKPTDIEKVLTTANLNMIQLHGNETSQQIQTIKNTFGLPVIKAIRIAERTDLEQIEAYEKVSDWLLFDTKSPQAQGGTGESFDWSLLKDLQLTKPWMLAGGLNSNNIRQALSVLKPHAVDVSSGIEDKPGFKNPNKIKEFINIVKNYK